MSDTSRHSFSASDLDDVWADHPYYEEHWTQPPQPDEETISEVEKRLGYRLPAAYIELCRHRNGGGFNRDCFPTMEETSWAEDHVAITAYSAIGWDTANSLCGSCGSQFMIEEWGYPPIGIVFGQCPSAGHNVIMLDHCECGPEGEPRVVHVD
ncbi:SMI1/KNR4 family protein [Schaalia cardiffensis]